MFGHVVNIVEVTLLLFEFKLLLYIIIYESVQAYLHHHGPCWLNGVVDDSLYSGVVGDDGSMGLDMSQLSCDYSFNDCISCIAPNCASTAEEITAFRVWTISNISQL